MNLETIGADPWRRRTIAGIVALSLLGAACGSTAETTTQASETTATASAADSTPATDPLPTDGQSVADQAEPADLSSYPDVVVQDVATGADVELASLISDSNRPVLLWFWAPH